jgi:hypothetical protein
VQRVFVTDSSLDYNAEMSKRVFERFVPVGASLLVLATVACSSTSKEVELLPQSLSSAPLPTIAETLAEGSEPPATATGGVEVPDPLPTPSVDEGGATANRGLVVVVDGGIPVQREVTPSQLRDASRQERLRRSAATPVAVITDENLVESGAGGHLTIAEAPKVAPSASPAPANAATSGIDEEYWRTRALELRISWKEAVDTVTGLESDVGALRQRFYAEDDPAYRDRQIKPAWDRALEALNGARRYSSDFRDRIELFLDEGRRAGALPGWLREGIEYQPRPEKKPTRDGLDANEPQIIDEVLEP